MIQRLTQALVDGMLNELELSEMTDSEMEFWALHYDVYNILRNDPSKYEELKSKVEGKRLAAVDYFWKFLEKGTLNENATYTETIDYRQEIKALTKHMLMQGKKIAPLPKVIFRDGDKSNAKEFLGNTAYYDPNLKIIVLYTEGRHPKDIVRSFAHEMIHHIQNLEGRLVGVEGTNTNEDDNLQGLEKEAYLDGNITFRNWTDSKQNPSEIILEIGEASSKPYDYRLVVDEGDYIEYQFKTDTLDYIVYFQTEDDFLGRPMTEVAFAVATTKGGFRRDYQSTTNKGDIFRIMATLIQIIKEYISNNPESTDLYLDPSKNYEGDDRRGKLYKAYIEKHLPPGWEVGTTPTEGEIKLSKIDKDIIPSDELAETLTQYLTTTLLEELSENQYTIYLDMDGVIADFDGQFEKYAKMTPTDYEEAFGTDKFWDLIDKKVGEKFWTEMEWMPGGKEIHQRVSQHPHSLLSSPSRGQTSRSGKHKWVEKHTPQSELILARSSNKKNYADEFNILIDDRESNIDQWVKAGGIGILYSTPQQVIDELNKLGL